MSSPEPAPSARLPICRESDVAFARASVRELATREGCAPGVADALATATSEIARNIIVHARSGALSAEVVGGPGRRVVVVIARDGGPGIADVGCAMQDGYTTAGGLGLGLSSARRLVDGFTIASSPGAGTTVTLRKRIR